MIRWNAMIERRGHTRGRILWSLGILSAMLALGVFSASLPSSAAEPVNIYEYTMGPGLSPAVATLPVRIYLPNSVSNTVHVIDPSTYKVIDQYPVGREPHHVTPSWDMTKLYVLNTKSDSLTVIDPRTGKATGTIAVTDPYNLYFTPDGKYAIVVAERFKRLDFRDPTTWALRGSVSIPYAGVDHLDFSADGRYLLASCEYTGWLVKVDIPTMRLTGEFRVGGLPIDVRLAPDGTVFYVANQGRHGVSVVDADAMREVAFIPTGRGAHGLYVSRDTRFLYVTNRLAGSISVIDFATRKVVRTWEIGGSPDMGGVTPGGRQFWISGRYHHEVYVIDTVAGARVQTIRVGLNPHGLAVFPQPGRYSLGHTGVFR
ncbi:MAG: cytochrome D1 domain-containing protein [Candidatus Binatia bacterium]